jgi:cytochrome c-type biogenesis protein CcmH
MRRREFLCEALAFGSASLLGARALGAQQGAPDSTQSSGTSNLFDMNQGAAKRVTRPSRAGALPSMTADARDALERQIRCQCGCTLDVYICRTTDFSCQVSPAMHRDVMALVEGGYSAQEILDAFVGTYGERALMAPKREGFNWAGYLVPSAAIAAGGVALLTVIRRMQRSATPAPAKSVGGTPPLGTDEEMARLDAAVRRDD